MSIHHLQATFAAIVVGLSVFLPSSKTALAAVYTVDTTIDSEDSTAGDGICATATSACSLRAAVQEANATPGPDVINIPPGTYVLTIPGQFEDESETGDLDITDSVTIAGSGEASTVVDGGGIDRVIDSAPLDEDVTVTINDLTITGGLGGIQNAGTLTLTRLAISENDSPAVGGAIYNTAYSGTADLQLTDVTITGNTAYNDGGGIFNISATVTLDNVDVVDNEAGSSGGGIVNSGGTLTATNLLVAGNTSQGLGGGVFLAPDYGPDITTITNSLISDNESFSGVGGGVAVLHSQLTLEGVTIHANASAGGGGGAIAWNATMTMLRTSITNNHSSYEGGGIASYSGFVSIEESTLSGNSTTGNGGAVSTARSPELPATPPVIEMTNSTLSSNTASSGGGIWNDSGNLSIISTTIAENQASFATQIRHGGDGLAEIGSSIVSGNSQVCAVEASLTSLGYNLSSDNSCGFSDPSHFASADPVLGPLADNGGPTLTNEPQTGSPAIDIGPLNCPPPATDQRGVVRPQNGRCDRGSVEVGQNLNFIGGSVDVLVTSSQPSGGFPYASAVIAGAIALAVAILVGLWARRTVTGSD